MAESVEESVKFFVDQVFSNETLLQSERRQFIESAMLSLAGGITDGKHRWGLSMTVGKLGQEAKQPRKKNRKEAVGFFGNWAKSSLEKKDEDGDS
jgi:hypothetical protein